MKVKTTEQNKHTSRTIFSTIWLLQPE